jgi:mRNA interferase YafQ
MQQIKSIMKLLESGKQLPEKNKDHNLIGNYVNCRECHIGSD